LDVRARFIFVCNTTHLLIKLCIGRDTLSFFLPPRKLQLEVVYANTLSRGAEERKLSGRWSTGGELQHHRGLSETQFEEIESDRRVEGIKERV